MKKILILPILLLTLIGCGKNDNELIDPNTVRGLYKDSTLSYKGIENNNSDVDKFFTTFSNSNHPYGTKFFVNIEQDNCSNCWDDYGPGNLAFVRLIQEGHDDVRLYTIFADEIDSNGNNLFIKYVFSRYDTFFSNGLTVYENSYLGAYENYSHSTSIYGINEFSTPTFYLIDFTDSAPSYTATNGISEVIQTINHSDDIVDAYYHRGKYGAPS